jgi:hypothetical protein
VSELITEIKRVYDTTVDTARLDVLETSRNLAQHIVDTALMEHPDILMRWIQQALTVLKRSRTLTLRYHPRLEARSVTSARWRHAQARGYPAR